MESVGMDYKEKLLKLANNCLNDESLYNKTIERLDTRYSNSQTVCYRKEAAIFFDVFRDYKDVNVNFFLNDVKCKSVEKMRKKYGLVDKWTNSKRQFFHSLTINFEDIPSLRIFLIFEETREEIKINIPHRRFLFFKGEEQFVIKTTTTYTPKYIIEHGSLKAELNVEEADTLAELYQTNNKKFKEKMDLNKLETRLEKYK